MSQYDDHRNPFSSGADSGQAGSGSPWGSARAESSPSQAGLQLPGEDTPWSNGSGQRPSANARRRNQWRQHQQLTPDFGVGEPGDVPQPHRPEAVRPTARNASLPSFPRAVPSAPGPRPVGVDGLQVHPHSAQPGSLPAIAAPQGLLRPRPAPAPPAFVPDTYGDRPRIDPGSKVTPLRPLPQRPGQRRRVPPVVAATAAATAVVAAATDGPPAARRSPASAGRRRLANPPLPLLYLIRLVILGVGVAAIAGTLLSVLSPANVASPGETAVAQSTGERLASGGLVQGTAAASTADLRLTGEIPRLKAELEQLATLTPGLTPVAFALDLDSGQYVDLGGSETVAAASTIKVPILVAFLQQVDAGTLALNQALVMREEDVAGGSGTLRGEAVGNEYTALEVATRMIVVSDNTATNMMIAALGGVEALNQTFAQWGLESTVLRNVLPDLEGTNTTSARDLALIMALVDQGGLLTPRSRDRLFSIMQRTQNDTLIPSGITDRSLRANKTGDIGSLLGDVALVDVPNGKRYVLSILVQRPTNDGRASELIRRMTETVHTEMAQPVVPVGHSNFSMPEATPAAPGAGSETMPSPSPDMGNPDMGTPEMSTPDMGTEDILPPSPSPGDRNPARDEIPPG